MIPVLDPATRARLVGLFVAEADESIGALGALSGTLRAAPSPEAQSEFARVAHGLKGAAAALGFDALATVLHDLEALSIGLPGLEADAREARQARIERTIELLAAGVSRMAASGADAFPEDLLPVLRRATGDADAPAPAPAPAEGAPVAAAPPPARDPGSPAAQARPAARGGGEVVERLSVPADDVDAALRLASSLARAAAQLQDAMAAAGAPAVGSAQAIATSAQALEGLIASLRLLPAESALSGLEAEIAALAGRLGKRIVPALAGRDVRADRRTLQAARGMIRHLVRNAVDHGIEAPAARRAAGKPEAGRLAVRVDAGDSALRVTVEDDGAGFDLAAIRAELARRDGGAARVASLSDEEVLRRWAEEGGSTRTAATEISGRGVGLSGVAAMAREAGGGLRVRSVAGEGSAVEFTLPLEVYAVEALTVVAGGRRLGIPLQAVERTVHLAAAGEAVHDGPTGRTLAVDETILPLSGLAEALGAAPGAERFAVVVRTEAGTAALAVEDVGSVVGMVPATIPGLADADALVTGLAQLGDGTVAALLHPRRLVERARAARRAGVPAGAGPGPAGPAPARAAAPAAPAAPAPARPIEVVLAEDSLATREVLRVLLEEQGFRVRVAADGEEALARIAEALPDVLVSDLNMPRRDGLALTRALRAGAGTARLPIVLLTSQDDDETRAAGADAGADAYLIKSRFNAAVLQDTLARLGVRARR